MNRRDALKALVAMPEVARISTAPVRPSDVIVVEASQSVSMEAAERIRQTMQQIWPNQRIVVLDKSLTLKIVEGNGV